MDVPNFLGSFVRFVVQRLGFATYSGEWDATSDTVRDIRIISLQAVRKK
jgi:hypothetical protein